MTIFVVYVPRPELQTALDRAINIAKRRKERLLEVNSSPGGMGDRWKSKTMSASNDSL